MKRVRCYRCGYLDKPEWFNPFKLAHKGRTRRIYLCADCISYCVTKTLKNKLTEKEKREIWLDIKKSQSCEAEG